MAVVTESKVPHQLKSTWRKIPVPGLILLLLFVPLINGLTGQNTGWRWLTASAVLWGYEFWLVGRFLNLNRSPDQDELYDRFGLGTAITLSRGFLLVVTGGFILLPHLHGAAPWIPAGFYLLAVISDGFDGYFARKRDHVTVLGQEIDMRFDALGILLMSILGIYYGKLPLWYLLIGLAYYLFSFGRWWRVRKGKPVFPLPPQRHRSVLAGFQMGFLGVMLWPPFGSVSTRLASWVFGLPMLVTFSRDFLIMRGTLQPDTKLFVRWEANFLSTSQKILLPLSRIATLLFLVILVNSVPNMLMTFPLPGWSNIGNLPPELIAGVLILGVVSVVFGLVPRLGSLLLASYTALWLTRYGTDWRIETMLLLLLISLEFGGGRFCLFPLEERWLFRTYVDTQDRHEIVVS